MRVAAVTALSVSVGWGGRQLFLVMEHGMEKMPAIAKSEPVKDVLLVTDGLLDHPWLVETLALPKGVSLLDVDLEKMRARVLASGQVKTATISRTFPSTLEVTMSERSPVTRIKAGFSDGQVRELVVARDGVVFQGVDFDRAMIETLPWLEGVTLARRNGAFFPLAGMEAAAELLATAKLKAEHLYRTWEVISLARLGLDGEIEVRTAAGTKVIFGTKEDYSHQLARLDVLIDTAARVHPLKMLAEINLALGTQVPVTVIDVAPADEGGGVPLIKPPPAQAAALVRPNNFQIKLNREL